jgi:hypothetical protein
MMKMKKIILAAATVALITAFALTSVACSPGQPSSTGATTAEAATTTEVNYPVGSLMTQHVPGVLDKTDEYSKKFCLSCHPRDSIVKANENYGGKEGVNPHAAHTESYDCIKCHSVDGTSIMVCNSCHDWYLPEGWENGETITKANSLMRK